jgi:hypothetical protein
LKRIIFLITIILSSPGCEKKTTYEYQVVDSDIVVRMYEELGTPNRSFELVLSTDKAYPCVNYSIITNSETIGNKIIIEIIGVHVPDICLTATGPACTAFIVSAIQDKQYDIEFKVGNNISYGRLICTSSEFSLQMNNLVQVKINGPVLKRVPDNLIWGTIGYHDSSTINYINDFIESLKKVGATDVSLENGNYNYFEIENNRIKEPANSGYWFIQSFVFRFAGDKNPVSSIVKDFSKKYGDLMSIAVYGDLGEEYLGWILKNQ